MKLFRYLAVLLITIAGMAYSIEAVVPVLASISIENTGEETEAKESSEVIAPTKSETRKVSPTIVVNHKPSPFSISIVGEQLFLEPLHKSSRVILHRALLL